MDDGTMNIDPALIQEAWENTNQDDQVVHQARLDTLRNIWPELYEALQTAWPVEHTYVPNEHEHRQAVKAELQRLRDGASELLDLTEAESSLPPEGQPA